MRESNTQTKWKQYLDKNPLSKSEVHELKFINYDTTKSFRFDKVKEHQERALSDARNGLYYKIGDTAAISGFVSPKPFDSFYLVGVEGYVVVVVWKKRKSMTAYKIPIERFKMVRDSFTRNNKKSLKVDDMEKYFECEVIEI